MLRRFENERLCGLVSARSRAVVRLTQLGAVFCPMLLTFGCSLLTVSQEACSTNSECRLAFGFGSTCGEEGFCVPFSVPDARCSSSYPENLFELDSSAVEPIVFGTLFDASNPTHVARQQSVQVAVEQINGEGGVEDRPFAVLFCDLDPELVDDGSENTGDAAINSVRYLTQDLGVQVILGPSSSGDVERVFAEVKNQDVFVISPSATSPTLTEVDVGEPDEGRPGLLWRTAPPDSLQGAKIGEFLNSCSDDRVAVIAGDTPYGRGLVPEFVRNFDGVPAIGFFENTNRRSELITSVGNSDADFVLFVSSDQSEVVSFLNAVDTIDGFDDKQIFLTDTAATENTLRAAPERLFKKIRGTRPRLLLTDSRAYATFLVGYSSEFSDNPESFSFTANAFDMTWIAMLGSAWAILEEGELNGTNIAKGVRRLSDPDQDPLDLVPSSWDPLVRGLLDGGAVNISGASGALDYDPDTEETTTPIEFWAILPSKGDPDELAIVVVGDGCSVDGKPEEDRDAGSE